MYYDVIETGRRIHALRQERGLTQEELANTLGITDRHIRGIESGKRNASIDLLVALANLFSVSLDYLILGKPTRHQIRNELQTTLESLSAMMEKL